MEATKPELKIYYDGLCPLCSREIDHYRNKDHQGLIEYIDIANSSFDAKAEGLDPENVHKRFHAKKADGTIVEGVDAFIEIWKTLKVFKPLKAMAESKVARPVFDIGYNVFAKIRPLLRKNECEADVCQKT